jgi:GntR family transcriptional regulator, transcriptional repressor for pyruvate dehydrogenase complex
MQPRVNSLAIVRHYLDECNFGFQDRLPPERELARKLGLTRTQLRSGMKQLQAEGVVWRHVGRGTFFGGHPAERHGHVEAVGTTTPRELMEARSAIEPQLARLAARHATADDIARMERALERSIATTDPETFHKYDAELHMCVAQAAHNALLLSLFKSMNEVRHKLLWGRLDGNFLTPTLQVQYSEQHRGFVEAIKRRDDRAAETLMRFHLDAVEQQLLKVALFFLP